MSVVPGNKLQQQLHDLRKKRLASGPGEINYIGGVINKVYDPEAVAKGKLPDNVKTLIIKFPGLIFIEAILDNSKHVILPLAESEDIVFSVYGNFVQLEGKRVVIEFRHNDVASGVAKILKGAPQKLIELNKLNQVYDIGKIL